MTSQTSIVHRSVSTWTPRTVKGREIGANAVSHGIPELTRIHVMGLPPPISSQSPRLNVLTAAPVRALAGIHACKRLSSGTSMLVRISWAV